MKQLDSWQMNSLKIMFKRQVIPSTKKGNRNMMMKGAHTSINEYQNIVNPSW